jgi:hypothetical protein
MNFPEEFIKGQEGVNKGLYMGDGLSNISKSINGIQRKRIYGVASGAKVGKSTFVDAGFVIEPYIYALEKGIDIEWIYYSLEIDRISKEFDFAAYFLFRDYQIRWVTLDQGVTIDGKNVIEVSPNYLRGRLLDDNDNTVKVSTNIVELLKLIYRNRLIPLFGEYDHNGYQIKKGVITFIEERDNPTGIYKDLMKHAEKDGYFIKNTVGRVIGYKRTSNLNRFTIVIFDHLRKLKLERGWQMKQTVDKMSEYMVELRNLCEFSFVPIIHTNRNLGDVNRIKFGGDQLYPTAEDIKDTGNLSEDVDYLFTMLNPNDDKYSLMKHFDLVLRDSKGKPYFPNLRTIHLVESRHTIFPRHFKVNMFGNIKHFEKI